MGIYASALGIALRPGAMLGLVVAGVVAVVGLVQLDQRLIIIGLVSGPVIVALNGVLVAVTRWHASNTEPGATYVHAEEMIEIERGVIQRNRGSKRPVPEAGHVKEQRTPSRAND